MSSGRNRSTPSKLQGNNGARAAEEDEDDLARIVVDTWQILTSPHQMPPPPAGDEDDRGMHRPRGRQVPNHGVGRSQPCGYCGRAFRRSDHLSRHIQAMHLGLKPFKCPECDQTFSRWDNLSLHRRSMHRQPQ